MAGKVAVIGLGSMGLGVARSLLRAGFNVAGFDVSPDRQEQFVAAGGSTASSPAHAAAGASAVIIMVVNAAQTESVLFGEAGAGPALPRGGVVISSATMAPDDARRLARRAEEAHIHYLDAPVSGGSLKANSGQLTVMSSGTPAAYTAARPVLKGYAKMVYELGDDAGTGSAFKMVNQLLAGVHIAAAAEAVTFAAKLGLDLRRVYEVITASAGNSWMFENRVPHILDADYIAQSAVDIFTKDLGILSVMGQREKFPLTLASAALQMFIATAAVGMGRDDDSSVARLIAQTARVELPARGL
jgi:3-hydroxyisobutyrate dehydrogenase